jgi:DNA-binding response OmpR family regulator
MNSKPQCLVVHGDREFLGQLTRFFNLSRPGCEVVAFSNSVEALEHARGGTVALIVTDYLLPQIDGLHFIQSVRRFDPEVPIILMSDVPVEVAALSHGATAFLGTEAWWTELEARITEIGVGAETASEALKAA